MIDSHIYIAYTVIVFYTFILQNQLQNSDIPVNGISAIKIQYNKQFYKNAVICRIIAFKNFYAILRRIL